MKTAISVPDETFAAVERRAADLGMTRSEFYTRAARRYLEALESESLTGRIDSALDLVAADDSSADAVAAGRRRLAADEEDW